MLDWCQVTTNLFKNGAFFPLVVVSQSSFPLPAPPRMLNTLNYAEDVPRIPSIPRWVVVDQQWGLQIAANVQSVAVSPASQAHLVYLSF
jgi:hypothetical protein